ncbi:BrnT family toxin [Pseudomonas asplenii]|uniref:BrnT family toxin n=1 Tax=Pseudomonas asplenii TaxID=53407 RepID=UPI00035D96B4
MMSTFQIRYDETGNTTNKQEHAGISLADAEAVFYDEGALRLQDREAEGTPWIIMGLDATRRLLVASYTHSAPGSVQLLAARIASSHEARQYLEN